MVLWPFQHESLISLLVSCIWFVTERVEGGCQQLVIEQVVKSTARALAWLVIRPLAIYRWIKDALAGGQNAWAFASPSRKHLTPPLMYFFLAV